MATTASPPTAHSEQGPLSAWVAVVILAGILLVMVGTLHAVVGVAAMAGSQLDLMTPNGVSVDDPAWGGVFLVVGALEVLTGYGVFRAKTWARAAAVVIAATGAALSVLATDLPGYAAALVVVVDLVLMYAVIGHGTEIRPVE